MIAALLLGLLPVVAQAQALPNLSLLRVRYNTAKTSAKPAGELKTALDPPSAAVHAAPAAGTTCRLA